ncbi:alpha-2-macroglobulin family protein [Mucilaginibacter terrae]|uniref:alpha-2-macroglobulin family protein n=1 Tax=Mucilaginibacter terrae TaxID=1955052 RepID=UPI00362D7DD5
MLFKCLKPFLLVVLLLFAFNQVRAQSTYTQITGRIDSLAQLGLPKSALAEIDKLDKLARQNNNTPQIIRAVIYRITFQSYLEENALVAVINSLKADIKQSAFPVKPVLQSMLANMYWRYYQQNRWQFGQRTRLNKPDPDFTRWDLQTIVNETGKLYQQSLQNTKALQTTPVGVLDGVLTGDKITRYLRPSLYDMLLHRAFEFYLADEAALTKPRNPFSLTDARLFGDSRSFANLTITTTDTASVLYRGVKYLQQATAYHLAQNNTEALADLDLKRLQFLYSKSSLAQKDSLYLQALNQTARAFASKPISADAWNLLGNYYKGKDSLTTAYRAFEKAVATYPQSLGGQNAAIALEQLSQLSLSATVEQVNVPGKPVLAQLQYKNLSTAQVLVYKLNYAQLKRYQKLYAETMKQRWQSVLVPRESVASLMNFLQALKTAQQQTLNLPNLHDYRNHNTEFKIDALPAGNYVLLIKKGDGKDTSLTQIVNFAVSQLAYTTRLNPNEDVELRVMDRQTGKPLKGVNVLLSSTTNRYNSNTKKNEEIIVERKGLSDANGLFKTTSIDRGNINARLIFNGDTLQHDQGYLTGETRDDEDNEAKEKTILFTDRQIYRPGQTIYFKGLQVQTLKGKSTVLPNKVMDLEIYDSNDKLLTTKSFTTNEFGSFNGSYIIPQNVLNGNIKLATSDGQIYVKAEEYKRPTFKVELADVKETFRFNDSVKVKGMVTAFSGYGLSQARVAYHVTRNVNQVYNAYASGYNNRYAYEPSAEIAADTVMADSQGNFTISFKAIPGNQLGDQIRYQYQVNVDANDASGETHTGNTMVTIGKRDIQLTAQVPAYQFAADSAKIGVLLTTLNRQQLKGNIKVQVYALQSPGRLFKKRLWQNPDQYLLSKAQYESEFPDFTYKNEDQYVNWPQGAQIINTEAQSVPGKNTVVDLDALRKQASGVYQVIIKANAANGDTASVINYITLINKPAAPSSITNWVMPVTTNIAPGQSARFLVGIGADAHILAEQYQGENLTSSQWMKVDAQRDLKISVTAANAGNTAVQYLMLYHNRLYTSYQPIYVQQPEKKLNVKLTSFRNKLQSGDKEEWALQVSGYRNDKPAAEMVAAMYDASLDDIVQPQSWDGIQNIMGGRQYRYYTWQEYGFIQQLQTQTFFNINNYKNPIVRRYEELNLFGYSYFGGYNYGYLNYLKEVRIAANQARIRNEQLEAAYKKNALLVKNGYDISGKLVDEEGMSLPGVNIMIKGTGISTSTNKSGNFKIKVPVNGVLVFSYIGYFTQEKATKKAEQLRIVLKADEKALSEMVVVGYGVQRKQSLTGSVTESNPNEIGVLQGRVAGVTINDSGNQSRIMLRGSRSLSGNNESLIIVDGVPGRMDTVNYNNISSIEILKDASATSLYGARAANGVIIITTKGALGGQKQPMVIRKNFNETAFFYPQLRTNEQGQILINFTMPESLTKWRFRAFAHTKDLAGGYVQQDVVTQKQLMVTANMPRFLREGDTISVSARVANLTAQVLKGKVQLQLFNALNMQPVNLLVNPAEADQAFDVVANTNKAVSFKLVIPAGLDALTYRLTAVSDRYSDGEENTLPVLPNRMLVTESMPMMVRSGQTKAFTFDKLVNNKSNTLVSKSLTLEYTQNPAWYAVQALPYLMEFPYECSEQIFSRYYANSLSASIITHNPQIKTVFERWKTTDSKELLSNLQKNPELKATLIEETPWLQDAVSEAEQKKRIALLYDLNKLGYEQDQTLDKLQRKQLPNGGFPWFGGTEADRFITQHIIAGIGQLYRSKTVNATNEKLGSIRNNALQYLDAELLKSDALNQLSKAYKIHSLGIYEIHAWYARSYFTDVKLSNELKKAQSLYFDRAAKQWISQDIYEQALIALTLHRNGKVEVAKAIIRSLMETAQQNDDMGMYWAKNHLGWYWYQSPVETQALMIELFTEAGNQPQAVEEMKVWLLRNKQTTNWRTTKATAAACYALLMRGDSLLTGTAKSEIRLDGKLLTELKPDVKAEAGTGYLKTNWVDEQIKPALGKVQVINSGKTISWGALHWQYTEQLDKITPSLTDIVLERKYFIEKQDAAGAVLTAVDAKHQPKTGDVLKVVVYLKAGRTYEYIHLKDMRPAGTEPVDVLSSFKYQDGLSYYQVTKDVATNFFISTLNKGNYVFEYRLRVAQPGNFSTGISTVQSMYAPEFNAHSEGRRMEIVK